ncbi:MAG: peptide ABC transporter substrate-binding protein [bacterium]
MFGFAEKFLYSFRDLLWNYPDNLLFSKESLLQAFFRIYQKFRPLSHLIFFVLIYSLIFLMFASDLHGLIKVNTEIYQEGIIVGTDENGDLQKLSRINPLINTNIQLEKDLNDLIYESLIRVDQNGTVIPVLADYIVLKEGEQYQFKLKEGLQWQDGVAVTTQDVEATFSLIQELDKDPGTSTIFSRAASKIDLTILDERSFEFKLKSVIPAFFESISFKILPSHLISDLNPGNIKASDPIINRKPVGTGPFRLASYKDNNVLLVKNEYYRNPINFKEIQFKLYPDELSAVDALRSGQVHAISDVSFDLVREIRDEKLYQVYHSNTLYNQYWALYFNLGESGPAFFKEKPVRQAISSAINRKLMLEALLGYAEEAHGPIPPNSFAYNKQNYYSYDKAKAIKLLDDAGWKLGIDGIRAKNGVPLSFDLLVIDNPDRIKIAEVISKDLGEIGIAAKISKENLQTIINDHIQTKQFQTVLYGVQTFIDPDRYELFHSSQIVHPGLNISSYVSTAQVLTVVGRETKKVPQVDDVLDDARKYVDKPSRKKKYDTFQAIINDEVPVVFLYYPQELFIMNQRVKNVQFNNINSIEDRFLTINSWKIEYQLTIR